MEIKFKKHVTLKVDLEIGETVTINEFGYKFDGKEMVIQDIRHGACQSGIQVKLDKYENYLDSDWIVKLPVQAIGSEI